MTSTMGTLPSKTSISDPKRPKRQAPNAGKSNAKVSSEQESTQEGPDQEWSGFQYGSNQVESNQDQSNLGYANRQDVHREEFHTQQGPYPEDGYYAQVGYQQEGFYPMESNLQPSHTGNIHWWYPANPKAKPRAGLLDRTKANFQDLRSAIFRLTHSRHKNPGPDATHPMQPVFSNAEEDFYARQMPHPEPHRRSDSPDIVEMDNPSPDDLSSEPPSHHSSEPSTKPKDKGKQRAYGSRNSESARYSTKDRYQDKYRQYRFHDREASERSTKGGGNREPQLTHPSDEDRPRPSKKPPKSRKQGTLHSKSRREQSYDRYG